MADIKKFLDDSGLSHLWSLIKSYISNQLSNKVSKTGDDVTGTIDFNSSTGKLNMGNVNNATYTTSSIYNIVPVINGLSNPPWTEDYWHDHFAFLRFYSIYSQETTTDGETWTEAEKSISELRKLFCQRDAITIRILEADELAYRFVLKGSQTAYSGISWFELGIAYSSPFPNFIFTVEISTDTETWTTLHNSTVTSNSVPVFFRNGSSISSTVYFRFTFFKVTNIDTGILGLTCLKAFTHRKGAQGLGREYQYPYTWDSYANLLPIENSARSLGNSSYKWKEAYITNMYGNATSADSATKLATSRTINGTSFDGSSNITITANPTPNNLATTDLDSVTTPGFYYGGGSNTCTNKPSGIDAFALLVYKTASGYVAQELTGGNKNPLSKYIRQNTGSWRRLDRNRF